MSIIPITVYGDKILRQKSKNISQINDELIEKIKNMFDTMRNARGVGLAANQVGFDESIFVIDLSSVEGLLNVYKKNSDGYEIQVGLLKPGDFFGEMSLFTGENRSATVKAVCNSVVYEITKEVIAPIIERRSVLAEIFAKIITQRNEINIKKIKDSEIKHKSAIDWVVEKIKTFFHIKN